MPKSTKSEEHAEEAVVNPRDAAMANIAAEARQRRDDEIAEDSVGSEALELDKGGESGTLDDDLAAKKVDITDDSGNNPVIDHDGKQFLKLNINGVESEMDLGEAVVRLQKSGNADLETAIAKEEQRKFAAATAELEQATRSAKSTQPDDTKERRAEKKTHVKDALQKLYDDGDVEGSAEILVGILDSTEETQSNSVEVVDEVAINTVIEKRERQRSLKDAFTGFQADERFKQLTGDAELMVLVDRQTLQLQEDEMFMAESPSFSDIFEKAGEKVLERIGAPLTVVADNSEADTVLERKRKAPTAVHSRTARRTAPEPAKPKTNSDVIADIAKSRGQTGYG